MEATVEIIKKGYFQNISDVGWGEKYSIVRTKNI